MKEKISETIRVLGSIGVIDGLKLGLAIVVVLGLVPVLLFGCGAHRGPDRVTPAASVESVTAEQAEVDRRLEALDRALTGLERRVETEKPAQTAGRCEIKRCDKI